MAYSILSRVRLLREVTTLCCRLQQHWLAHTQGLALRIANTSARSIATADIVSKIPATNKPMKHHNLVYGWQEEQAKRSAAYKRFARFAVPAQLRTDILKGRPLPRNAYKPVRIPATASWQCCVCLLMVVQPSPRLPPTGTDACIENSAMMIDYATGRHWMPCRVCYCISASLIDHAPISQHTSSSAVLHTNSTAKQRGHMPSDKKSCQVNSPVPLL